MWLVNTCLVKIMVKIMVEVYVQQKTCIKCLVVVAFQKCFFLEMYQNNYFFYFLKIIFDISASK